MKAGPCWKGLSRTPPHTPITDRRGLPGALLLAHTDDPLPELEGHVGDMAGAGDGRGVERCQVWGRDGGPARRLQVDGHQLLLHQHHEGLGVFKAWGGEKWLLHVETPKPSPAPWGDPGRTYLPRAPLHSAR